MTETTSTKCSFVEIKDITAGAGALGLLGYGMAGVLASLANTGMIESGSMIISMAIFMGGFAMFTAGLMEWKKGNTYGMAAYSCFGLFWFSYAALLLLPALGIVKGTGGAGAMAAYLALWGLFTLITFICALKLSNALAFVLGTLTLVFFLEAAGAATGTGMFTVLAGYIGILSGLAAIYTAVAPVINDIYGKTVAPIG
ncbi:acetate uptake transporter [uncultured Methanoregula sp.]|uniref:acetate uptake transporter n=1 Tax=uncultured Methanoregula sp. TaxID=1005933 RepID=UPI002AAB5473|nr:acetate uptake transporter [uncultured Methanoregula sp.]